MAAGILMLLLGVFLLMRTVNKDGAGKTLADHILR